MHRAQAARADADALGLAIHHQLDALYVGGPSAFRVPLGMAHIAPMLKRLAANFTLCHRNFPFQTADPPDSQYLP